MAENQENEKELSDHKKRTRLIESLTADKVELTAKVKELWEKASNLDLQVLDNQKENEALKAKYDALNEVSRQNLAKKNFVDENSQKLQAENEKLLRQNGALVSENKQIEKLNEIKTGLESEISDLKNHYAKLNDSFVASEQVLKELNLQKGSLNLQVEALKKSEADLKNSLQILNGANADLKKGNENLKAVSNDLRSEIDDLRNENAAFKKQIWAKNGKMNTFKTVVIFLAVLANFLLLGKKFMGLTGEKDWQTYLISYGSVLIFDLTVIFLTMVNRSKEALYFGIGVFILTFFQIGKPFLGLSLDIAFYGFNLLYFERIISGCIYSFFFAFLSYFLSKIEIKS